MKNFFATITIILLTFSLFAQSPNSTPNPPISHPESHPELDSGSPASPISHPDTTKSHPELDSGSPDSPISHPDTTKSHPDTPISHPELDSGSPVTPQDQFPTEDLYNNHPEKSTSSSGKLRPKDNTTVVDEVDDIELTGVEKKKNEQDRKNIRNNAEESRSLMLRSNELNKKIEKNKIALLQKSLLLTNNFAEDDSVRCLSLACTCIASMIQ